MKRAAIIALLLSLFAEPAFAGELSWTLSPESPVVSQGGVVEINVKGEGLAGAKGEWLGQEIIFFPGEGASFTALLGVDMEGRPGTAELRITGFGKDGEERERRIAVRVKDRAFPLEEFAVPPKFDRIDKATMKRIEEERAQFDRLWTTVTPGRLWQGRFAAPVPGGLGSPFGLRRIINGSPRSPHSGVDFKAPLGTEVVAPNDGRVVLTGDFFFSGKSLVLDHGGGLYTMYFHLDRIRAKKDSYVRKGEVIADSGKTGRVSGPHLHWGVRLNGARVDPFELLEAAGHRQ